MQKQTCPCPECPQKGDRYVCDECGFAVRVEEDCACEDLGANCDGE